MNHFISLITGRILFHRHDMCNLASIFKYSNKVYGTIQFSAKRLQYQPSSAASKSRSMHTFPPLNITKKTPAGIINIADIMSNSAEEEIKENGFIKKVDVWKSEQEKMLYNAIMSGNSLTSSEWVALKEKVIASGNYINSYNVDAIVIGTCTECRQLALGFSYLDHLSSSGKEPNAATIARFLKLCYICLKDEDVPSETEKVIIAVHERLVQRYQNLDANTAEKVIHGLSVTSHWAEGLQLLDTIKLTCTPSGSSYSVLINAAFHHNEPDIGWKLLDEMLADDRLPTSLVYHTMIQYCNTLPKVNQYKFIEKLFTFFAQHGLRPIKDVAVSLKTFFEQQFGMEEPKRYNSLTFVTERGICNSCRKYLAPVSLTSSEFEMLRSRFLNLVVVGSNVFVKTTPSELNAFKQFIERTAPYKIVIDGLNVAYSAGAGNKSPNFYAKMLQSVVKHFVDQSQKVLVLGRKHMLSWPKQYMDYVHNNAKVFLAQNMSQDDPFLLYAAMFSGLGTCFISRDLMRSHAYLLQDTVLKSYFLRWQQQHQYELLTVEGSGRVRVKSPLSYNPCAQHSSDGSWHIPYDLDLAANLNRNHDPRSLWLCLNSTHPPALQTDKRKPKAFII